MTRFHFSSWFSFLRKLRSHRSHHSRRHDDFEEAAISSRGVEAFLHGEPEAPEHYIRRPVPGRGRGRVPEEQGPNPSINF
jgi:hypothetical protein